MKKINLKNDGILTFGISKEKRIDTVLKKLVSNSISEKKRRSLKPVGTRPGIMWGLCKVHKDIIGNFLPFRPILSAINIPNYKLAKFLVPILKSLISNEYTVKDSFAFAEEIVEQDSDFFMGSLDVDSLFTNIQLEETIDICTKALFQNTEKIGLSKIEFKELLSFATNESDFIFNEKFCRYLLKRGTTWNNLKPPTTRKKQPETTFNEQETTYNEQEVTLNDLPRAKNNLKQPEIT